MTDQGLKQTVLDELVWEPSINEAHIGVTAHGGVVTLTAHVGSYAEKCAAVRAAGRVSGVSDRRRTRDPLFVWRGAW